MGLIAESPRVAFVGGVYTATDCALSTVRGADDYLNKMAAGCAAGAIVGVQSTARRPSRTLRADGSSANSFTAGFSWLALRMAGKRASVGAGACAAFAAMAAAVHLAGGRFAPEDRKSNEFFRQFSGQAEGDHGAGGH